MRFCICANEDICLGASCPSLHLSACSFARIRGSCISNLLSKYPFLYLMIGTTDYVVRAQEFHPCSHLPIFLPTKLHFFAGSSAKAHAAYTSLLVPILPTKLLFLVGSVVLSLHFECYILLLFQNVMHASLRVSLFLI